MVIKCLDKILIFISMQKHNLKETVVRKGLTDAITDEN